MSCGDCLRRTELPYPAWLVILLACIFVFLQSSIQSGYYPAIVGTLESTFNLTSKESGTIISLYDIATLCFVTHVGHLCGPFTPRALGIGMALMGASAMAFAAAALIDPSDHHGAAYALLLIAQAIFGFGASPLYIVTQVYFAANLSQRFLSLALGLFSASGALGPAAGFLLAGLAVDSWHWASLLSILGATAIVFSIPLFLAPLRFGSADSTGPKLGHEEEEPVDEKKQVKGYGTDMTVADVGTGAAQDPATTQGGSPPLPPPKGILGFFWRVSVRVLGVGLCTSIVVCLTEPTFMWCTLGACFQAFLVSGINTFFPSYVSHVYGFSPGTASIYIGVTCIPGAAGGILLGGYIMKRLDAGMIQHIRLTYISTFITCMLAFFYFLPSPAAFLGILVPVMASLFMGTASGFVITMRAVPLEHRGVALGIQSVAYRALGSIPGPVALGAILDADCIDFVGSCQAYDNQKLQTHFFAFSLGICLLGSICFVLQEVSWRRKLRRQGIQSSKGTLEADSSQTTEVVTVPLASTKDASLEKGVAA